MQKTFGITSARKLLSPLIAFCALANLAFCLALFGAGPAHSVAICALSMQDVAFGSVSVTTGAAVDISATLQVSCRGAGALGQRACINFNSSAGSGWSDDATSRKIPQGTIDTIRYNLYSDAARTILWGSWAVAYQTQGVQADVFDGTTNITVYARLLGSQQAVSSGSYSVTTSNVNMVYRDKSGATACPVSGITANASYTASVTVEPSCTVGVSPMNFGSKVTLTTIADATSTVSMNCSNNTPYTIALNNGLYGTGPTARRMKSGGAANIDYAIYSDAARSVVWGENNGSNTVNGTGIGATQAITAYGRVPVQATPVTGTYTDTIVVTVSY